jgi:tetratricopeptide (TPR) repeat protein
VAGAAGVFYAEWSSALPTSQPTTAPANRSAAAKTASLPAASSSQASQMRTTDGDSLPALPALGAAGQQASVGAMEQRIAMLEQQVKSLQQALSGVSLEKASADRQRLFASEEGYLKADEYAAAGQHAIAGEGYLTFLQNHPQHPDARDVMKKARDSFLKAGYKDKAFWVHEEMMKANPQHQLADMEELAHVEKDAGRYDRAMEHMAQAAQLDPDVGSRLWKRMYWAWFVRLQNGNAAGIDALTQVQREIATSGINSAKLNERVQQQMGEMQQQLAKAQ